MKRLLIFGVGVALALSLAACTTPTTVTSAADSVELVGVTADTALDASYKIVATAYLKVAPTLPPATKATYKTALQQARPYVVAADAGLDVVTNAAAAMRLLSTVATPLGVPLASQ